jgi:hypothetical protein
MNIPDKLFPVLGIIWVVGIFIWVIKDHRWHGVFACAMIAIASIIASFDKVLGVDGEVMAFIFALAYAVIFFSVKKIINSRKRSQ